MSLVSKLYTTMIELSLREQEMSDLKEEYECYRKIVESTSDNKKVRKIKKYVSWYSREELKKKAKKVAEQEWLDYSCNEARREEGKRRREGRREREEKKRAAERKALDELMEKERRERNRKNKDAN